jgi:hypothetical protein
MVLYYTVQITNMVSDYTLQMNNMVLIIPFI